MSRTFRICRIVKKMYKLCANWQSRFKSCSVFCFSLFFKTICTLYLFIKCKHKVEVWIGIAVGIKVSSVDFVAQGSHHGHNLVLGLLHCAFRCNTKVFAPTPAAHPECYNLQKSPKPLLSHCNWSYTVWKLVLNSEIKWLCPRDGTHNLSPLTSLCSPCFIHSSLQQSDQTKLFSTLFTLVDIHYIW